MSKVLQDGQTPLLSVDDLTISFPGTLSGLEAVSSVSFNINEAERVALVGESGSGKTLSGLSCLGLAPKGATVSGSVNLDGTELVGASDEQLRKVRGKTVGVVFQDPSTSLNPVHKVGDQISEMLRRHEGESKINARKRAIELMKDVKIPAAEMRYDDYPHQLSGGMKQRILIAIALSLNPKLLVLDEPTTALDVTVEAQIMDLLLELSEERQMALLLISHDLGVVSNVCERVLTMYAGQLVEEGPIEAVYEQPAHPYTAALLDSIVEIDEPKQRLEPIPGQPPSVTDARLGCRFQPRCRFAQPECAANVPLIAVETGRSARCLFANDMIARTGNFTS